MERQSNFLPERVSGAIKNAGLRASGAAVLCVGVMLAVALVFHNPYLDGFAAAGTFGRQSVVGNIVGFVRYGIGFIPAMFLFLYIARMGLMWMAGRSDDGGPEYNVLRCFIAVAVGAAGLGMIANGATFGGMAGAVAGADMARLIGPGAVFVGIALVVVFALMAAALLHITASHVRSAVAFLWRVLRWLASVFHLTMPSHAAVGDAADADDAPDDAPDDDNPTDDASDDDNDATPTRRVSRRRAARSRSVAAASVAAPADAAAHEYELPDPRFLEKSTLGKNVVTPELKRNAAAMEVHFAEYGVRGKVVGIRPGPIVTLYEFMPDSGTRMVDISKTVKDMTRAMATENIRIAHIPRTELIGVEMVNLNRQTVRFQSLIDNPSFINSKYRIPLALGVDIGGNPMYFDLAKMPHVLIAGRTGSGKSVFVQSIITSIVYHFTPDKCKLMIIDPKGVDFNLWDDIPHLITPVVKLDPNGAVNALKWSVREMEERYKQLQFLGVQNIEGYNEAVAKKRAAGEVLTRQVAVGTDPETGELEYETQEVDLSDMAYLVIVIDEVADLMSVARKEVEACVQRLAQKARAAGIHLVMATQRPDATTITGVIKANFPTRISFQARSNIDSMTTLGEKGAENLLACGDMLFSEAGRVPVRIHGAFIENTEINRVADFLRSQGAPEFASGVTDGGEGAAGAAMPIPGMAPSKDSKDADLYTQAKEYVIRDKKPTISYIQRRLGVGYNKAAGFMERMEQEGVVSAPDANNKRHIL